MSSRLKIDEKPQFDENERRWLILRARVVEEKIKAAFCLFRKHGLEPVLIKGWAAAREYPFSYERNFSDIDLCVSTETFDRAAELIKSEEAGSLNIDLHRGLRHLDTMAWEKLFQNSKLVRLDDVEVRILRPEDHLRVLCVHWLTDGGAYKEKLLDIYYLLQNNSENFDWDKCFEPVDRNRRDWIVKTIAVVHEIYDLEKLKLPFAGELNLLPRWFVKALQREWASETKLVDINIFFSNREELWKQVKLRFRPNPIQATVFMEGKMDDSPRIFYQTGSFFLRLKPLVKKSIYRLKVELLRKFKGNA